MKIKTLFISAVLTLSSGFVLAGKTYNRGIDNQVIVIYYLDINLKRTDDSTIGKDPNNSQLIKYIPSYSNHLALESSLKMVIKHELGHAFGLGHYISEDQDRQERWSNGSERPPSIMIPIIPTKIVAAEITSQDIEEIIKIYGKDSFKDKDNFSSKDVVKEQKD